MFLVILKLEKMMEGGGGVKIQLLTGYRRSFLVQIIEMCEKPKIQ